MLRKGKWVGIISLVVCLLAIKCSQSLETYASLEPTNAYVGKEACQSCHQEIYADYIQTGMGKSLYKPSPSNIIESFGPQVVVYDSIGDYNYHPYWNGNGMFVREYRIVKGDTVYQRLEKIDYVVGSGHQTRSYLIERDGYLFEVPITWYVQKQLWDLSPGYTGQNSRFDREIGLTCLACHTGTVDYIPLSKNRYRFISEGIDCEKCHGPGQQHIKAIEGGQLIDVGVEIDYTIVNPAKLPIDKQFDVCQQCHLQGENVLHDGYRSLADFRPAMKLNQVADIFVEVPENQHAFGIASHAQRLKLSTCFQASDGQLSCTTCHNPHKSISKTDPQIFIKQCQSCHQAGMQPLCQAESSLRLAEQDNCISCHMPKGGTSDIPHVSFHDHYIRVVEEQALVDVAATQHFVELMCGNRDSVSNSSLGQAWLQYYESHGADSGYLTKAIGLLQDAPVDVKARLALYQGKLNQAEYLANQALAQEVKPEWKFLLGEIIAAKGDYTEAEALFSELYQTYPDMWEAGLQSVINLLKAKRGQAGVLPQAMEQLLVLKKAKPFDVRVWANLGFVAMNQGKLPQAESFLVRGLKLDPDHPKCLENMVYCQVLKGNQVLAKQYFLQLEAKHPKVTSLQQLREALEG